MTSIKACLKTMIVALFLGGCGDDGSDRVAVVSGPDPFDQNVLATFEFSIDSAEWEAMVDNLEDNTWRRCTLEWQGETFADVAIHPAGQSSRKPEHRRKPSFWISFKEFVPGRKLHGYDRLKLDAMADDPAMIRERLAYEIYAVRGVPAPRVMHCRVVVNGRYQGLYLLEERINRDFVRRRFDRNTVHQLYRWTEFQPDMIYDPEWPPSVYAGPAESFPMWGARLETPPIDDQEVRELMRVLNVDPAAAGAVFDVESFLNFMAVEVATGETDGYVGNNHTEPHVYYTGNIFLYKNPGTGRYVFMVWDRDQSFWRPEPAAGLYDVSITHGFEQRIATRRVILDVPGNLDRYKSALRAVSDTLTHPDRLLPRVDAIIDQIREAAFADSNRLFAPTNQELIWEWEGLKRRVQLRWDTIREQLGAR